MAKQTEASKQVPGAGRIPEPPRTAGIKVRATQIGYYDHKRRREGDVFTIDGETYAEDVFVANPLTKERTLRFKKGTVKAFSPTWMERVDPSVPEHTTPGPEALKLAQDAIRGGQSTGDRDVLGA